MLTNPHITALALAATVYLTTIHCTTLRFAHVHCRVYKNPHITALTIAATVYLTTIHYTTLRFALVHCRVYKSPPLNPALS
jgi:uncharacterized cysteine cluster protein YcgN (CxxCxxCC family)